ncbi:unnamed protein product [Owenia fusiformis]|uniref:TM2 domain-containing protein n=1 Tax=Owenia fusiformis TaxID=6347 RepID=A0A8J1Y588_OWEFU|nr:unnamed protein product [Owenia fusiformis]
MTQTKEEEARQQNVSPYQSTQGPTQGMQGPTPSMGVPPPVQSPYNQYPGQIAPPASYPNVQYPQAAPPTVPHSPTPQQMVDPTMAEQGQRTGETVMIARQRPFTPKSTCDAYLLGFPLGFLGLHNFYLRRYGMGIVYLLTLGCFGVGMVVDWFRMPCLVKEANRKLQNPNSTPKKSLGDAYVLWFPLGIFGFHRFYLGSPLIGLLFLFTIGGFGIGWIIDGFCMKSLVDKKNQQLEDERNHETPKRDIDLTTAYVLCVAPTGIFGAHHYYMGRTGWGILYTFTGGLFFLGWLFDICRLSCVFKRTQVEHKSGKVDRKKHLDDAYVLCFPLFGLLGLHHFYLERHIWGLIYVFTFGLLGIGWLSDFCRLPCLVREYNRRIEEEDQLIENVTQCLPPGQNNVIITGNQIIATNMAGQPFQPYPGYNDPIYGQRVAEGQFSNMGYGSNGFTEVYTVNNLPGQPGGLQYPGVHAAPGVGGHVLEVPPAYDSLTSQQSSIASSNVDGAVSMQQENAQNETKQGVPSGGAQKQQPERPPPPYKK